MPEDVREAFPIALIVLLKSAGVLDRYIVSVGQRQEKYSCQPPLTTWPPEDRCLLPAQIIGPPMTVIRAGRNAVTNMIHVRFSRDQHIRVPVMIAMPAQPWTNHAAASQRYQKKGPRYKIDHDLHVRVFLRIARSVVGELDAGQSRTSLLEEGESGNQKNSSGGTDTSIAFPSQDHKPRAVIHLYRLTSRGAKSQFDTQDSLRRAATGGKFSIVSPSKAIMIEWRVRL